MACFELVIFYEIDYRTRVLGCLLDLRTKQYCNSMNYYFLSEVSFILQFLVLSLKPFFSHLLNPKKLSLSLQVVSISLIALRSSLQLEFYSFLSLSLFQAIIPLTSLRLSYKNIACSFCACFLNTFAITPYFLAWFLFRVQFAMPRQMSYSSSQTSFNFNGRLRLDFSTL